MRCTVPKASCISSHSFTFALSNVLQLTRDIGIRLVPENIRINAVCPGFVYTALTEGVTEVLDIHETMKICTLWDAWPSLQEIAFLASGETSFVTGAAWTVDGGYTAT